MAVAQRHPEIILRRGWSIAAHGIQTQGTLMRKLRISLAAALAAVTALAVASPAMADVSPNWTLESASGETIELQRQVSERPQVVLFWATWCPFCKALMPHLQSIKFEHGDDIDILAVSIREDGDPVAYLNDNGMNFIALPDGDEVAALYEIRGTPGVLIIDGDREIRFDLRDVQARARAVVTEAQGENRRGRAAGVSPYLAAEIRKSLTEVLNDSP